MDGARFDRMARALGGTATRRGGLGAALGGLLALAGGGARATPKGTAKGDRPETRGACADGRDARCAKPADCCTGVCETPKGAKTGRCRCRREGQACAQDRNCCSGRGQGLSCRGEPGKKTCQAACAAYEAACGADADCCAGMVCDGGACKVDCAANLEGAGCTLNGNQTWNCGNTGGHAVDLSGVHLSGCDLTNASFFQTDASKAVMIGTVLTGANFNDATVSGVVWDDTTCPAGTNSDANGGTCCGEFAYGQVPTGCGA